MNHRKERPLTDSELEQLLKPKDAPRPPADLAERIKAEIPASFTIVADSEATVVEDSGQAAVPVVGAGPAVPWVRRRGWLLAASVVLALGAGVIGYRTVEQAPPLEESMARPSAAKSLGQAELGQAAGEHDPAANVDPEIDRSAAVQAPLASKGRMLARADRDSSESQEAEGSVPQARQLLDSPNLQSAVEPTPQPVASNRPIGRRQRYPAAAADPNRQRELGQESDFDSIVVTSESPMVHDGIAEEIVVTGRAVGLDERRLRTGSAVDGETSSDLFATGESHRAARRKLEPARDSEQPRQAGGKPSQPASRAEAKKEVAPQEMAKLMEKDATLSRSNKTKAVPVPDPTPAAVPPPPPPKPASPEPASPEDSEVVVDSVFATPSTGGTAEPNDQPYGDVFFRTYGVNPFIDTEDDQLSTFGLDVDTGSYTVTRRYLRDGNLPPAEAIRVEEMVNYFDYGDRVPKVGEGEFALHAEGATTPFAAGPAYRLVRFGIQAREIEPEQRKSAVLTFVVDVSGSMDQENRLGLVKRSLRLLMEQLRRDDEVGLVVYGSRGKVLLAPSNNHQAIGRAIERLVAEGSTNAEEGLVLAYELARKHFKQGAINRVILCSDGVANVGNTGPESILEQIGKEAADGVELTTVGFGMGNYNDVLMEQLADQGNGQYAYVDNLEEARRIFVENLTGTLQTIASDAKAQVEFNPEVVSRYRLIGYENRDIADERFRDDTVDAGEIGAGHGVTALYEVKLAPQARGRRPGNARLATLRLRYRSKASGEVVEMEKPLALGQLGSSWEAAPQALRLASLVAEFGEILKGAYWAKGSDPELLHRKAQGLSQSLREDPDVEELVQLIGQAATAIRAEEGSRESHRSGS